MRRFGLGNFRLSVRACVALLMAVVAVMTIGTMGWLQRLEEHIRQKEIVANEYHLNTAMHLARIREELSQVQSRALNHHAEAVSAMFPTSPRYESGDLDRDVAGALHTIAEEIRAIVALQGRYGDPVFTDLLARLEERFVQFTLVNSSSGADGHDALDVLSANIDRIGVIVEQLRRLHVIEHRITTTELAAAEQRGIRNFLIFAGILLAVGCAMIWRLKRLIGDLLRAQQRAQAELRDARDELLARNDELAAAKRGAEQASRAKSEFLANMSHEIRLPMTAILGFAEVLSESARDGGLDHEASDALDTIRRNGDHLLEIVNEILDLSKIEAGKFHIEQVDIALRELIDEVAALMKVRGDSRNLTLEVECLGPLPTLIRTDPTRLKQILINLIGNGIKFTQSGGVRLAVRRVSGGLDEDQLRFDVIDTGVGMTCEQIGKLFRSFGQADASTARLFGGTGLGLSLSKQLATLLGGSLSVSSTPDEGSTFTLTIPIIAPQPESVDAAERSCRPPIRSKQPGTAGSQPTLACRVLLAEDSPDNSRLISFVLRKAGADVSAVENGRLAVDEALRARGAGRPYHVILMDMQMPAMDGCAATRFLRSRNYTGAIVALTANAMSGDREKCIDAGCDDYASKPINRAQLIAMVSEHAGCGQPTPASDSAFVATP